jgi:hypothetical protein
MPAKTSTVTIPINFGRQDKTAPKHAPFGVLASVKNLRHREVGGLGLRNGYQPLTMTTINGTLAAYDLHDYRGRLVALGSDAGDGYPTDLFEYSNLANQAWRGTDRSGARVMINPFTRLREVAGVPQLDDGIEAIDVATGGGHTMLVFRTEDSGSVFVLIVDDATDQTVHQENLVSGGVFSSGGQYLIKATYTAGRFFIAGATATLDTIRIARFTVGASTRFGTHVDVATAGDTITAMDLVPVTNGTTAQLAIAYDRGSSTSLDIKIYDSAGAQVGSTISVATTTTIHLALEADQTDNTINLYTVETATDGRLRTFNFSGSLLDGPTTVTSGASGSLCRLPAQSGFAEHVAVAVNSTTNNVVIQVRDVDTHGLTDTITLQDVAIRTRPVSGQSPNQDIAVVFGGIVAPNLPTIDDATNALFFVTADIVHMSARDYLRAKDSVFTNLMVGSTGSLCWASLKDPGVQSLGIPTVSLVDFQSTQRRQSAPYGGLLYFAGATPFTYDGRFPSETGFGEVAGIHSVTPSNSTGSLTPGARYDYQWHWEYVFADGSLIPGPPSQIETVTMGGSDDTNTLIVTTPHSVRIAAGDALFGADVVGVLSRTVWDPVTGTPGSVMRRAVVRNIPIGMANYGELLTVTDTISDVDLADEEPIYTQSERGALSGTLEANAPEASTYVTASESRILTGGLSRPFEFQLSKEAFLGESFTFSEFSNFFGQASGPVLAVYALDSARLIFTRNEILAFGGSGPDDLGAGSIPSPQRIPTVDGLKDWRSLLEVPEGLFCQLDDDKLYQLPRGAGAPQWAAKDVIRELKAYPTITGAARHRGDNAALFGANTLAETSAKILVQDLELKTWLVDEPPLQASSGITAMVNSGRSVAYTSGGVVYVQSLTGFTDGASSPITGQLVTRPIYPFGLGGYGQIVDALLSFEFRGACDLQARVSYDDGLSFSSLTTFSLTGTTGQSMQRSWALSQTNVTSVVFELTIVPTGTGTEGIIINELDLAVMPESGLKQLNPAEIGSGA